MRTTLILIFSVICILACNKKKDPPPAPVQTVDSTDTTIIVKPILKDSSLKFVGIDTVLTIGVYDSITIPFSIIKDTGSMQNVTLSISGLPMRVKSKFVINTGTTPFTTSLKLYTYLVAGGHFLNEKFTITATAANGQQTKHEFKIDIDYIKQDPYATFYAVYKQSPVLNGPTINYDTATGKIYLTQLPLGAVGGKTYFSIDDPDPSKNIIQDPITIASFGDIFLDYKYIKGTNGTDTLDFFVMSALLGYYVYSNPQEESMFYITYRVSTPNRPYSEYFGAKGTLVFY